MPKTRLKPLTVKDTTFMLQSKQTFSNLLLNLNPVFSNYQKFLLISTLNFLYGNFVSGLKDG